MSMLIRVALVAAFFVLAWGLPAKAQSGTSTLPMICLLPETANGVLIDRGLRPAQSFIDKWGDDWTLWLGQDGESWTITTDATDSAGRVWRCLAGEGPPGEPA